MLNFFICVINLDKCYVKKNHSHSSLKKVLKVYDKNYFKRFFITKFITKCLDLLFVWHKKQGLIIFYYSR